LDIGVLGYIGILYHKEHPPEVWYIPPGKTCIMYYIDFLFIFQLTVDKDGHSYFATLEIKNVTVEDAGKYKVTAKNELGESNATISLNFDSKYLRDILIVK
jgi:hypothetical protein